VLDQINLINQKKSYFVNLKTMKHLAFVKLWAMKAMKKQMAMKAMRAVLMMVTQVILMITQAHWKQENKQERKKQT